MEPTLRIYVFRPQSLDSGEWDNAIAATLASQPNIEVVDWGDSRQIHQYITIRTTGVGDGDLNLPSLSFLAGWLRDHDLEPSAANGIARLAGALSDLLRNRTTPYLSIMLPSGQQIQVTSTPDQKLSVPGEFSLPLRIHQAELESLLRLQGLERRADLRIKFASTDERGGLVGDSHDEYEMLFKDLPASWNSIVTEAEVNTDSEGTRRGWLIAGDQIEVGGIEHETGIELVIAGVVGGILLNAAGNLVSDGVVGITKHLWNRWRISRTAAQQKGIQKASTFLQIEQSQYGANGELLGSQVVRMRNPDDNQIEKLLRNAMMSSSSGDFAGAAGN